ncbi:MAK1-like monooxygenase [Aspergillus ustus]|uniref:MAK1-like monooxygenase n=1 Tax=Aspergillus ustus TaxID=40382 RepID=A0A0C1BVY7_ASPUT|nr:MAK1-like monooxygenase [Aspergillus ustus]
MLDPRIAAAPQSSGITVIIVGLGIAGLTTAISCHLRGHTVIGFDKLENLEPYGGLGDGVTLAPNGTRVLREFGNGTVAEWMERWALTCTNCKVFDTSGNHIGQHPIPETDRGLALVPRGKLVQTLYEVAQELGLDLRLGVKITEYYEDHEHASVVVDGTRFKGDCILFADGANSKHRKIVSTRNVELHQSGFSVYRGKVEGEVVKKDPKCHWLLSGEMEKDVAKAFSGPNMYLVLATCGSGKACFCIAMSQNTRPLENAWTTPIDKEEVLKRVRGWKLEHQIRPIIEHMSKDQLINTPLVRAGALDSWVSPTGRIALIGDAAHPFFPTSAQGASQAIEDGATVAITLQLAGKRNIKLGLNAMMELRKHRATYIQHNAWRVNDEWFRSDQEERTGDKASPTPGVMDWIIDHCCQTYAWDEFDQVRECIETGIPYHPSNLPAECYEKATNFLEQGGHGLPF